MNDSSTEVFSPLPRAQFVKAMRGILAATFLGAFGNMVVATALPGIVADLGAFDRYVWPSTAFLLSSTTVIPITGRLADLYGCRPLFIVSLVIFLVSSLAVGLSQTMDQVIAFRIVQGIGGGMILVVGMVGIADLAPPQDRGKYHGLVGLVLSVATVTGPLVGGLIIDHLSWGWVFLINIPLGIPILIDIMRAYPRSRRGSERLTGRLDYPGMVALVLGTTAILLALSTAGTDYAWGSPQIIGLFGVGAVATALFVAIELRSRHPIMPLSIYRHRVLWVSVVVNFFIGMTLFASIIFIPLFFQSVQGASAGRSGAFLAPLVIGITIGAVIAGQVVSRIARSYMTLGLFSTGLSSLGAFLLSNLSASTSVGVAVLSILVIGIGVGGVMSTFTVAVQNTMPQKDIGLATSIIQFQRAMGGTLGVTLLGGALVSGTVARLGDTVPAQLQSLLPEDWLDPAGLTRAILNPSGPDSLADYLASVGAEGGALATEFAGYMGSALSQSLDHALVTLAALTTLSLVAACLLRTK